MPQVLIVDDSAVDRRLAGGILAKDDELSLGYAANGAEALFMMAERPPDLVLSDVQMPELNGLELVESVRTRYPLVPVVLMTAAGSEDLAMTALQRGAAGYVPKSRLAHDLLPLVHRVLETAAAGRRHDRLMECLTSCDFTLRTGDGLIPMVVDFFQRRIAALELCDGTVRLRVALALEAALTAAMYCNLEIDPTDSDEPGQPALADALRQRQSQAPYGNRRIHVHADLSRDEVRFAVRHEGASLHAAMPQAQIDPAELSRSSRGLMLIGLFMDSVTLNPAGNELTLIKRRDLGEVAPAR